MSSPCSVCNKKFEENDDVFECDGCTDTQHVKCGGVTKKDCVARNGSKSLRLYCSYCVTNPAACLNENVTTILKFLHKIDLFNQQQVETNTKVNRLLANTIERVNEIGDKIESLGSIESNASTSKKTNTNAVKTEVNPVVVDPVVDGKNVKVCKARNIKDGGVVLSCVSNNDTMRVKQKVEESYGENYEVSLPEAKKPRVRITNVSDRIDEDKLIGEIKMMNSELKDAEMKLVTVINKLKQSYKYRDIVVEVNGATYKKLLKLGEIFLDWRQCAVSEHLHIQRCFKCCGFSHISSECKSAEQKCSICAGPHRFNNCTRKKLKCITVEP